MTLIQIVPLELMITGKDNPVLKTDKIAKISCALLNLSEPVVSD